jgi:hypothetical protein
MAGHAFSLRGRGREINAAVVGPGGLDRRRLRQ